jgi:hypothetical protein
MLIIRTRPHAQPEKAYALRILLDTVLGLDIRVEWADHLPAAGYELQWSGAASSIWIEDHFFDQIPDGAYLHTAYIPTNVQTVPSPFDGSALTLLWGGDGGSVITQNAANQQITIHTDVVAAAFFMVTRWEEYVVPDRDVYGRFEARSSIALQRSYLHRAVVHEWAELVWQGLLRTGVPAAARRPRAYKTILSCDVDHPRLWWQPHERVRTVAGAWTRGGVAAAWYWLKGPVWRSGDPFDTFDAMMERWEGIQFNFLGDRQRTYDCWYDLKHPSVRDLMRRIAAYSGGHRIGFHPSREAHADPVLFARELASLRAVSPLEVRTGRQHYLLMAAPYTWRLWAAAGMDADSTMGYSDHEGFRAGICVSYPVFDVERRVELGLLEEPLIAMDVTLAQYQHYTPDVALAQVQRLQAEVKRWSGEFRVLWHNSSWHTPEWEPYVKILEIL